MKLIEELKRRNVVRVGIAYLLLAWVVIQVTDTVAPVLNLPDWTLAFVTWAGIIGLPFVLFFSWVFELTPDGLKLEKDIDRSDSITTSTGQRLNYFVIALLAIAVVLLLTDKFSADDDAVSPAAVQSDPVEVTETDGGYDSIGVLPFVNMSDDPSQEYFSDGIAEELLNALAKLEDLQVAARTSSFAFKNQNIDITDIGKQLKVDTLLEGSVRKSGSRLRITAQLIDVDNGYHIWSETYDRELTDIFAIQDEITDAIVAALLVHFDPEAVESAGQTEVTNMSAYDAYLQGRHALRKPEGPDAREALRFFRAATEADPEFAPAWAARAFAVVALREDHFSEGIPREESHLLARTSIDRALAIDPNLAEAYVAQSFLLADDYQYEAALQSLEKALEFNPNLAEAWMWRSRLLGRFGRVREARENILKAIRLDPHNPTPARIGSNLAGTFYDAEFFAAIKRSGAQFPRVRNGIQITEQARSGPLTAEFHRRMLELGPDFPGYAAQMNVWNLKEIDEEALSASGRNAGDNVMWIYMSTGQWEKGQAMYDALPQDRQKSVLNLEELSAMQASQGKCQESLETLREAHGDDVPIYGELNPNFGRSNINLALNRVYCLRQLGRDAEAEEILAAARVFIETLRQNTVYGMYFVDAKLRLLEGDEDGALGVLEAANERYELAWSDRHDPVLRTLTDEPRFDALFDAIDANIDAVRAELGMPPADF
jgi:TolB-like protein